MADKRDANEKELVKIWRQLHCHWIAMDRNAGFDGVLISPFTGVHIVEVKNPMRKWELTEAETMQKQECEARGVIYNIIQTDDEAIQLATIKD